MSQSRYQIVKQSFQMALDQGWQDHSNYRFAGPVFDGLLHYISISVDNVATEISVEDYAKVYLDSLQSSLQGFTVLKQGPINLFDNNLAYEIVYQWRPNTEMKLIQRSVFVNKQKKIHILSTSFTANSWKKLYKTIDNMMRSFQ